MELYIIVDEYLNHFYNEKELANYLGVDESRVVEALESTKGKIHGLVLEHKQIIDNYDPINDNMNISKETDALVVDVAHFIIDTKSSIRKTALKYKLSKTTIGKYMNNDLPKISIKLYKEVFDVLQSHKSLSIEHKVCRDILNEEIKLLEEGLIISEIAEALGLSINRVERDLAKRSRRIDIDYNEAIKAKLYANKMKMNKR